MSLEPLSPATAATPVPPSPTTVAAPSTFNDPVAAQAIVRRLDWLFRNAPPTPAMQKLRDMVQRYRLEIRP
ncbi:hypothetical protein [Simplicispira lacusdiani]|uniref:hypothetical protein n=1 Tax=Simplicispira lacusdiani TaxID=2213010 RepID=UPI001300BDA9|nr:hypothetical protein [Simplicispira lacusdiani]